MATVRVARRTRYTSISRPTLNDKRLSWRALGLLVYLLDKPDDWRADSTALARMRKEGREAVRTAMRELADAGYLVREKRQDGNGKWVTETVVYEEPPPAGQQSLSAVTEDGFPGVGLPGVGLPGAITNTRDEKTDTGGTPNGARRSAKWSPEAESIARTEWERRTTKPVCGWPALCTRVQETLDAGYSKEEIAAVMPTMPAFSRSSFDFALRRPVGRAAAPVDTDRAAPSGEIGADEL